MVDFSKIRDFVIGCKHITEKDELKDRLLILENLLKVTIDDKGYLLVDDKVYDYRTDEFVRYATEDEINMVFEIRNIRRKLK